MLSQLLPIAIVGIVAYVWWGNTTTREKALVAAKKACELANVQLLDDSVSLKKYRLLRDHTGSIKIARLFTFEFSVAGNERRQGFVSFVGTQVKELKLLMDRGN